MSDEQPQQAQSESRRNGPWWESFFRNVLFGVAVLVMLWLVFNAELPPLRQLQAQIESLGWIGIFAFVALYAVVAVTPIPVTIMAVTGGLLFGVILGSVLSVVGVLIGCWGAYWLARALGRQVVTKLLGSYGQRIEHHLEGAGFQAVCMLRLLPGIPYWPVNYGSGAFGIGQRDFLVASVVSTIPGQVSLVAIGTFIADPTYVNGTVVVGAWILVAVMTIWAYRAWRGTAKHQLPGV